MNWIRKRLSMAIVGQIFPALVTPLLAKWLPPEVIGEVILILEGIIAVYIFGQSWSDTKLIEKGIKTQ